jgi:hypothetical protein
MTESLLSPRQLSAAFSLADTALKERGDVPIVVERGRMTAPHL